MKKTSEFGKGLTYCLALFLCHSERKCGEDIKDEKVKEIIERPSLWFYAASDHLYELQIPKTLSKNLQTRLKKFQYKCMGWRLPMDKKNEATKEDKEWAIKEAKDLIRLIDKSFEVKTMKAEWD